jgi:hypothetical protein
MGDKNTERRLMNHPFNNLCLKAFLTVTLLARFKSLGGGKWKVIILQYIKRQNKHLQ